MLYDICIVLATGTLDDKKSFLRKKYLVEAIVIVMIEYIWQNGQEMESKKYHSIFAFHHAPPPQDSEVTEDDWIFNQMGNFCDTPQHVSDCC